MASLALVACGDDGESPRRDQPTSTRSVATTPAAEDVELVPVVYHDHINDLDFEWAWQRLSPELQIEFGGYETWMAGYDYTLSSKARGVEIVDRAGNQTTLAFQVRSRDVDACDRELDGRFEGTWIVEPRGSDFQIVESEIGRSSGEQPITDPSACPEAQPVAPPPPPIAVGEEDCDPSYVECIPSLPPDLDCYDIGQEVEVIGDDPHYLDADFDGVGCEAY